MGEVLPLRPGMASVNEPAEGPFEPDPALIDTLERALTRARSGDLISFIMIYETYEANPRCLYHTGDSANLGCLLTGLAVEHHRLTDFLTFKATEPVSDDEEA